MDDPDLSATDHLLALQALARINKLSCTASQIGNAVLRILAQALPTDKPLHIIDVACGGGDGTIALSRRLNGLRVNRSFPAVRIRGIDISPRLLEKRTRSLPVLCVAFFKMDGSIPLMAASLTRVASRVFSYRLAATFRAAPLLTHASALVAGSAERVFRVGDAAGFVELFTGERMGWALCSARVFAEALVAGTAETLPLALRLSSVAANYRAAHKTLFAAKHSLPASGTVAAISRRGFACHSTGVDCSLGCQTNPSSAIQCRLMGDLKPFACSVILRQKYTETLLALYRQPRFSSALSQSPPEFYPGLPEPRHQGCVANILDCKAQATRSPCSRSP